MKKRMLTLLEETANHYNLNNRSVADNGVVCSYVPYDSDKSEGCAIGRKLDECHKEWLQSHPGENEGSLDDIVDILNPPKVLEGLPCFFLQDAQGFHDTPDNWTEDGLSEIGVIDYIRIKGMINNEEYHVYPTWDRDENKQC